MKRVSGWMFTDCVTFSPCPKCKQEAGDNCLTPKGRKAWPPHGERVSKYRQDFPSLVDTCKGGPGIDRQEKIRRCNERLEQEEQARCE